MFRLLFDRVKCNRSAVRLSVMVLVIWSLMMSPLPSVVHGQSCQQGGSPVCGLCGLFYNVIYDPYFDQTSCSVWQFGSGTERAMGSFGRFNGPSNGQWQGISQTTITLSGREDFDFTYDYEINDPLNDPNTQLQVWIFQPNATWYFVDAGPTGAQSTQYRSISLGSHPEWAGQAVHVYFWAYQPCDSEIIIDNVALWQY